jgi:uncharacterized protein involved in exopolysaccharide biosynthesis
MNANLRSDDISLGDAIRRIADGRIKVAVSAAAGFALGVVLALVTTPVFLGEVVVLPQSSTESTASSLAKRFSGIAALAGIELPTDLAGERDVAIATLTSYETLSSFIAENGVQDRILEETRRASLLGWLPLEQRRTMWQTVRQFRKRLRVVEDDESSLVKVSVEWFDAPTAAKWTNTLVAMADERLRRRAIETSRARISYLQKELGNTTLVAVRDAVGAVMEGELRSAAVAGADREFALKVIDPAVVADKPVRPRRALLIIALTGLGTLAGMVYVVLRPLSVRRQAARTQVRSAAE